MTDPRYRKLAKLLAEYSTALKKGDRILLDMVDVPDEFTIEMIRAAREAGAVPIVETRAHEGWARAAAWDERATCAPGMRP